MQNEDDDDGDGTCRRHEPVRIQKEKEGHSTRQSGTIFVIPEHKRHVWFPGVDFGRPTVNAAKKVQNKPEAGAGTLTGAGDSTFLPDRSHGGRATPEVIAG